MKAIVRALVVVASGLAVPALAETPVSAAPATPSVQTTPISDILKIARARAVLEKELPQLRPFYPRIGDLTLAQVAQSSHGLLGESKLKAIQDGFDTIR